MKCVSPGFGWICNIDHHPDKDRWRFTSGYAAFLIVISISNLPSVQSIFTTSLASYLGKISYAFYLTHGIVLRVLITPLQIKLLDMTAKGPEIWYHSAVIVSGLLFLIVAIPCADLVWRALDIPSVELARWLESQCAYEEKPILEKGYD